MALAGQPALHGNSHISVAPPLVLPTRGPWLKKICQIGPHLKASGLWLCCRQGGEYPECKAISKHNPPQLSGQCASLAFSSGHIFRRNNPAAVQKDRRKNKDGSRQSLHGRTVSPRWRKREIPSHFWVPHGMHPASKAGAALLKGTSPSSLWCAFEGSGHHGDGNS